MIVFDRAKYFRDGFSLAADFTIGRGACVAILGPSGAGKSTLLNLIAGFDELQSGRLLIDGVDMAAFTPAQRPVSLVFQDHNCFAHLDAWSNVALGLSPTLNLDERQKEQVAAALSAVGISLLAQRKPGDMSGGERQRIAIARVLVRRRPILLLDEAFAALGPALRREMLVLVANLHKHHGLTTLMVTHQPEDAQTIADQVVFVDEGRARKPEATADFFRSESSAIRKYLGAESALPP
jgi:thiamine transport system ATP-binding protein